MKCGHTYQIAPKGCHGRSMLMLSWDEVLLKVQSTSMIQRQGAEGAATTKLQTHWVVALCCVLMAFLQKCCRFVEARQRAIVIAQGDRWKMQGLTTWLGRMCIKAHQQGTHYEIVCPKSLLPDVLVRNVLIIWWLYIKVVHVCSSPPWKCMHQAEPVNLA